MKTGPVRGATSKPGAGRRPGMGRVVLMAGTLFVVTLAATGAAVAFLYVTSLNQTKDRLRESVQAQARHIEAVAASGLGMASDSAGREPVRSAVLSQLCAAQRLKETGRMRELAIAERHGDSIAYVLHHRRVNGSLPATVPFAGLLGSPMRRALSGESGTMIGPDYRGVTVVAAYEPVGVFGWGAVEKIDLAEVRAPFVRAGFLSALVAFVLIAAGTWLFFGVTNPVLRRMLESEERYRTTLDEVLEGCQIVGSDWRCLYLNEAAAAHSRRKRSELVGLTLMETYPGIEKSPVFDRLRECMKLRVPQRLEAELSFPDGSTGWFELDCQPVADGVLIQSLDVTARKQAEQARRSSEDRYRFLFDRAPVGIVTTMPDGLVVDANLHATRLLACPVEDLRGVNMRSFYTEPELRDRLIERLRRTGQVNDQEVVLRRRDGSARIVLTNLSLAELAGQQVVFSTLRDVTELKRTEDALTRQSSVLETVLESSGAAIFSLDREYRYTSFNSQHAAVMKAIYGKDIEPGHSLFEYQTNPEDQAKAKANLDRALAGETVTDEAYSGEEGLERRYFEISHYPVRGPLGDVTGVAVYARDVTPRRKAEEALRESEEKFRTAFDHAAVGKVLTGPDGRLLRVNDAFCSMLGYTREELQQLSFPSVTHPDDLAASRECVRSLLAGERQTYRFEKRYLNRDGSVVWADVGTVLLCNPAGQPLYFITHVQNVTERKKVEQDRERLNRELAAKNTELEQLIRASSHDLRTPLIGIQGFVGELEYSLKDLLGVLRRPDVPMALRERVAVLVEQDIPEDLKFIQAATAKMTSLLAGLLRLSRVGRAEPRIEELDMNQVMADTLRTLEFGIRESWATLKVSELPRCVGDAVMVGQVFANLVENAIKYRDARRPLVITITGRREGANAVFGVEDTGIGIPPALRERIFDPFYRVDPTNGTGEGLGLTIVSRIVERLGGKVSVESVPGKGSRFQVVLPAKP